MVPSMKMNRRAPISLRIRKISGLIDLGREGAAWHTTHASRLRLF